MVMNKDSTAYVPIVLPFRTGEESNDESLIKDIINEDRTLNENELFLFQFPRYVPMNIESQVKLKNEEIIEDQIYDGAVTEKKEFENLLNTLPKNSKVGKLKVFKSGKIKLQIGENLFDINPGINNKFAQEVAVISTQTNEAIFLPKIKDKKIVVTPDLNLD